MNFPKSKKLPLCLQEALPSRFKEIKNKNFDQNDKFYGIHEYLQEDSIVIQEEGSEIVKFLKGKHILVTGATGFLGKLLVEKLLRTCDNITIYLLIREKKGKDKETRLNEILNSYVFYKLSHLRPKYKNNIICISGDISKPGLDLEEQERKLLADKINIIYHTAATVRFDEPLRNAVNTNVLGIMEIVKLAESCVNFEVLTHVSTAYSNCNRNDIGEEIYKPTMSMEKLVNITRSFSDDVLQKITPGILGDMPNTYTLTKQAAEDYLKNNATNIATCICRPSIVLSTLRDPMPGWGENLLGPIGFIVATGLGFVHIQRGRGDAIADLVPADYVINHCIAASSKTAKERNLGKVPVYNCVSSSQNPITWRKMTAINCTYTRAIGSMHSICDPFCFFTMNDFLYNLGQLFFHTVPAYILDFSLTCVGKKPVLKKGYKKLSKFASVLAFFSTNEFHFDNSNTVSLFNCLNEVDKRNFNFNFATLSWETYSAKFCMGAREFILQDSFEETMDQSIKRIEWLTIIRQAYQFLLSCFLLSLFYFFIKLLLSVFM